MPPSEEAIEYLESLIIFDQICPFAIEHLPAMSRRVFDVGLDMGRMRQSLKPHKNRNRSKSSTSAAVADEDNGNKLANGSAGQDQMAVVPQLRHRRGSPDLKSPDPERRRNGTFDWGPGKGPDKEKGIPNSGEQIDEASSRPSKQHPLGSNPPNDSKLQPDGGFEDVEQHNYDLKPPPPNIKVKHLDTLSEKLWSGDHLAIILKDPSFFLRFTAFLNRYKPHLTLLLMKYLEAQKAFKAVEYANALSETLKFATDKDENESPSAAASMDPRFEEKCRVAFDTLVSEALPAYITNCLSKVVTEYMVREMTGTALPVMRELVGGLAEVFCLADPSMDDCPIVYASEEFYRTSRYSRDDVIGRNCRFLQGPKTNKATIARIRSKIKAGQECSEIVLNYRRDGNPFMNLLLTAPLYDNKGNIKYFIGAQIDVSGLIEDGRGLESFERLLFESHQKHPETSDDLPQQKHLRSLSELGQMLTADETSVFTRSHSRQTSSTAADSHSVNPSTPRPRSQRWRDDPQPRRQRLVLGDEDSSDRDSKTQNDHDSNKWTLSASIPAGKLPGVYQNYLLLRPYPSLRIIFVSPSLRIPGLLQSPILSRIAGPPHVKAGLAEAFEAGAAVTAKVNWLHTSNNNTNTGNGDAPKNENNEGNGNVGNGEVKVRYISCTPLLGSDDEVGVWMVVMVENEIVPSGSLARRGRLGLSGLRRASAGDVGEDEDYAGFMRSSAAGSAPQSRGGDSARGEGLSNGVLDKDRGVGKEGGLLNGLDGGRRVEEVFTPSDEKTRMM